MHGDDAVDRGNIDDGSSAFLFHPLCSLLTHKKRTFQVDLEGLVPGRFFHFNRWTEVRVRCSIVDENINRFSFPVKLFKEGIYLRKISVMTGPYRCLETFLRNFLGNPIQPLPFTAAEDDTGTESSQRLRCLGANTATRSCDQCKFP